MNKFNGITMPLRWLMASLLIAFAAGCSDGNKIPGTVTVADTTAPIVSSTLPLNGDTGLAVNTNITPTFSEAMDPATITDLSFTLKQGATPVTGVVTYTGTTATFNPTVDLAVSVPYTATVTTVAKDLAGNALAIDKTWSFITGATADTTPPTVSSTLPLSAAIDVAAHANITATFSEAMDPATITTSSFTLKQGTTPVTGVVTYTGTTATFNPTNNLAISTPYTATVTTVVKDLAGNALAVNRTWSFTTAATAGELPVNLGLAGNYAILAKSGISTVPASEVTGDIGVSPSNAAAITGFSLTLDAPGGTFSTSGQVTGKVYAADYAPPTPANLTTAVSDMEAAYADAAGRVTPDFTELGVGEIGGQILAPGLYKWSTGVSITTSNVTLDGGPTDVWIFQISGGITQATNMRVTLAGGALPKNIFWQAAGAVTLDTNAQMNGVILSQTGITLAAGAQVNGRLLAQTAVTLNTNRVTQPAP